MGRLWAQVSVLTQHNDNSRTGANLNETALTTANVNVATFGKLFGIPVDGFVFAQPLYLPSVNLGSSGIHNVLLVVTMHDSVYAFDADTGVQLWHQSLGTSVTPSPTGNIQAGEVGILSTPVIDPSTNTVYVVAKTLENSVQLYRLHALDIVTGAEKFSPPGPIEITAQYPGSAQPNDGAGHVLFNADKENQRASLTLDNGVLYIAFSSYGDHEPYHGWVLAYNATTLAQLATFNDTPNGMEGGIWMSGQGLVVDSSHNVYCITGNSAQATENNAGDFGESFLKLGLNGSTLSELDYFKVHNYDALNAGDFDLGSGGPVAIPGTSFIVGGGKQGLLYVVNTNSMGQLHTPDNVVQEFQADGGLYGGPIFWNNPSAPTLYVWGVGDSLKAYTYNVTNGKFNTPFVSESSVKTPATGDGNGAISISANQNVAGTAIVWATIPLANPDGATVHGKLYAFDATNVSKELWDSGQDATRDDYGNFAKFCPPTVVNGKVYVATDSLQVCAYGLNPPTPVWHHIDISALATAPAAAGDPAGYVFSGSEFVVYRGKDNHVHQLFAIANQGSWSHVDLTGLTNAPLAVGNPSGYVMGTQQVVYRGTDNHIHQLSNNGAHWTDSDLSLLAGAPTAAGDPFGSLSPGGNQIVDYTGTDQHIHHLYNSNGHWVHTDLTAVTSAPLCGGDPFEYLQGSSQIVPFRGVDNDIHQIYTINNTQWVHADLSKLAGAPPSAGDPFGYIFGTQDVVYRGTDGDIHLLFLH